MENRGILIDTSIVIDYLRSAEKENTKFINLFKNNELYMSVITVFELFNGATSKDKQNDIEKLLNILNIKDFDVKTAKIASDIYRDLRQQNKLIEFRDILIGATALQNSLPIATLNKKHFERLNKIILI